MTVPLSINQEHRLRYEWIAAALGMPRTAMHTVAALYFPDGVNYLALESALRTTIDRHHSLRTGFIAQPQSSQPGAGGQYSAFVSDDATVAIPAVTVGRLAARNLRSTMAQIMDDILAEPFCYDRPPLVRSHLIRTERSGDAFVVAMPHLLSDGWSTQLIEAELTHAYSSAVGLAVPPLPSVTAQYGDFAAWQRRRLAGEVGDRLVRFWRDEWRSGRNELVNDDELFNRDHQAGAEPLRTTERRYRLARCSRERVAGFAKDARSTVYAVLLTAFAVLLSKRTKRDRVAIWVNFANRVRLQFETVVGWLANPHIVRCDLSGDPTAIEALTRVRASLWRAHSHQELPFSLLWQKVISSQPTGAALRASLDPSHITFDMVVRPLPRHGIVSVPVRPSAGENSLKILATDLRAGIQLEARYARSRFEADDIEQMLIDVGVVLDAIVAAPATPLSQLRLPPARAHLRAPQISHADRSL
jgi:Condensation domain